MNDEVNEISAFSSYFYHSFVHQRFLLFSSAQNATGCTQVTNFITFTYIIFLHLIQQRRALGCEIIFSVFVASSKLLYNIVLLIYPGALVLISLKLDCGAVVEA